MSDHVNPNGEAFAKLLDEHWVDMTGMIGVINRLFRGPTKRVCFTKPKGFGKTHAAAMLAAYCSKGADSNELFRRFAVGRDPTFEKNLNALDVLYWNTAEFVGMSRAGDAAGDCVDILQAVICGELRRDYPGVCTFSMNHIPSLLTEVCRKTGSRFVLIIDDWDAVFQEFPEDGALQDKYLHFLRGLFQGLMPSAYLFGAFMTGILPIRKSGTQSGLTNFDEYTMIDPGVLAPFVGFNEEQVAELCRSSELDLRTMRKRCGGFRLPGAGGVFCPASVIEAVKTKMFKGLAPVAEPNETLRKVIGLRLDGLSKTVDSLIAGRSQRVNTAFFRNDVRTFSRSDEVLTLLVHLGFLAYDEETRTVAVPNEAVREEFLRARSLNNRRSLADES